MKRDAFTLPLDLGNELIIDNFAGGGGTSTGLEAAFGRPVDIAINHDPEALAMHALNHPYTKHLCESVWDVDPIEVTQNRPVGLVWLSPDCKHFSKAKGSTPVSKNIRGLAWVTLRWLLTTSPRTFMIENVEEFVTWGDLIEVSPGIWVPDPSKKGETFRAFIGMITSGVDATHPALAEACEALGIELDSPDAKRLVSGLGYTVDWRELRACDNGAPTLRKRLFIVGRRDGLPIVFPEPTHGEPASREVLAGMLAPYRTAAECIDFSISAPSIFGRQKELVRNTLRRVAKGMWRHVLASPNPFIVPSGDAVAAPFVNEHANASNQRTMRADEPLRTICAQVKGGHFSVVAPTMVKLRGTSEAHLGADSVEQPLSTVSAGGNQHALASAHLITVGYGERPGQRPRTQEITAPLGTAVAGGVKQAIVAAHITKFRTGSSGASMDEPMPTVTANSFVKRPGGSAPLGIVSAHLMHVTHHGERAGSTPAHPLPTITGAHRGEQALATAFFEQANGGFWEDNGGRPATAPLSTIASKGANQRLITAYLIKYYSSGGQWQDIGAPMHTLPTKARMGLVQAVKVPAACLPDEHRAKARMCAALLREHLPDEFTEDADMVMMLHDGAWWVLVDITLRMLKDRELYRGQAFPDSYIIHEIPDPKLLFVDGVQVPGDPRDIPRIPLSITARIRMCGNSVSPVQAEALVRANFGHERLFTQTAA
ncbi:DNA cytosine methyltransferase [Burkholderia vietnamiensis]|jgi:DNA (cytosine-5)-methyltransferase 1|uniref:DNA (cytosine-5-)-methyltransferase n=1 Tax=Burkholderia aenigmatica TaxID=2015348 RepID=A0A6P2LW23_9BURK|nr:MULTISPECIES: DNA cytosine methyltransferase [Burkholderia]HDR9761888.1 DNA cytosine methyltransferase [Burkholderia cepacia ATCC 25416]MBR7917315.1 DNA cytosine methyltransferase [Burkholderia vietnamiensis]MBR8055220.1 DNA cytosine methyltransferase [Burkholderia vietnamiensis]VWB72541.1 DNA methyltransferase [Burkholderia aenigmatica]HDR9791988.1 DNA cytosine methyltransferase [Burkholderia cepacia ATCC 25416]